MVDCFTLESSRMTVVSVVSTTKENPMVTHAKKVKMEKAAHRLHMTPLMVWVFRVVLKRGRRRRSKEECKKQKHTKKKKSSNSQAVMFLLRQARQEFFRHMWLASSHVQLTSYKQ